MKKIKVKFLDLPSNYKDGSDESIFYNVIYQALCMKYQVEISENPDYVFSWVPVNDAIGVEYAKYNCVRCQIIAENVRPDFNCFDYAVGILHDFKFEDRYFYLPASFFSKKTKQCFDLMQSKHIIIDEEEVKNRKFCSFVVSNGSECDIERELFFNLLNEYKRVDSGGRFLNNIGHCIEDRLQFDMEHKFSIAFENARYSPVTEKIAMSFAAQTVPIYWGNPKVGKLYNEKAFINCHRFDSFDDVLKEVRKIDNDDALYLSMLKEPAFLKKESSDEYLSKLASFLENMIETPKEIAIQRTNVGWSKYMQNIKIIGTKKFINQRKGNDRLFKFLGLAFNPWRKTMLAYKVKRFLLKRMY